MIAKNEGSKSLRFVCHIRYEDCDGHEEKTQPEEAPSEQVHVLSHHFWSDVKVIGPYATVDHDEQEPAKNAAPDGDVRQL